MGTYTEIRIDLTLKEDAPARRYSTKRAIGNWVCYTDGQGGLTYKEGT
jgi:hypothetical protein